MEELLPKLLMINGNETSCLSPENRQKFESILIELMNIKYDIRWCKKSGCPCHPETKIKEILHIREVRLFLEKVDLLDKIREILDNSDEKITVFDKYDIS